MRTLKLTTTHSHSNITQCTVDAAAHISTHTYTHIPHNTNSLQCILAVITYEEDRPPGTQCAVDAVAHINDLMYTQHKLTTTHSPYNGITVYPCRDYIRRARPPGAQCAVDVVAHLTDARARVDAQAEINDERVGREAM